MAIDWDEEHMIFDKIADPNDAPNGRVRLFVGLDGLLYTKDENGVVTVASDPGITTERSRVYQADQFELTNNADWAVNAPALFGDSAANQSVKVQLFDDTIEKGVGFTEVIPTLATKINIRLTAEAVAAPPALRNAGIKLYYRKHNVNAARGGWNSKILTDMDFPSGVTTPQEKDVAALVDLATFFSPAIDTGFKYQFQLTRVAPVGTNLTGNMGLVFLQTDYT